MSSWRSLLLVALIASASVAEPAKSTVAAPMRDGVRLRADLYVPESGRPWPVLVHRTPYDRKRTEATALRYAAAGLAPTAIAFQTGRRVGVMVAPSMFPLYAVNRNTGEDVDDSAVNRIAVQKIFAASRVSLPVATP